MKTKTHVRAGGESVQPNETLLQGRARKLLPSY
jgi:hypothetical protein